jgi:hypothetical protein
MESKKNFKPELGLINKNLTIKEKNYDTGFGKHELSTEQRYRNVRRISGRILDRALSNID